MVTGEQKILARRDDGVYELRPGIAPANRLTYFE